MANTPHYNLFVTDDMNERLDNWYRQLAGAQDSNMVKIDTELFKKAATSKKVAGTLSAAAWVGASAPYTQQITVEGLTAEQNGSISLTQSATPEQREAARNALLFATNQTDGSLTITADGEKPKIDIPAEIILLG